jgi:hypothetical protein
VGLSTRSHHHKTFEYSQENSQLKYPNLRTGAENILSFENFLRPKYVQTKNTLSLFESIIYS